ncbi:MAG: hypothetical protein RI513_06960, partial [Balneolaceae bacterium]|nr:hypothetical protein [Balneolaceae bacterium]
ASARVEPNLCLLGVRTHKTLFNKKPAQGRLLIEWRAREDYFADNVGSCPRGKRSGRTQSLLVGRSNPQNTIQ